MEKGTIHLPKDLHQLLKLIAAQHGVPMQDMITRMLYHGLAANTFVEAIKAIEAGTPRTVWKDLTVRSPGLTLHKGKRGAR
jgi:hypothetical protein